jgi:hypothetical protein
MNGPALSCRFDDPLRREGRRKRETSLQTKTNSWGWLTNYNFFNHYFNPIGTDHEFNNF